VGVYSLVAEADAKKGQAIQVMAVELVLPQGESLTPERIYVSGQDDEAVKHSAKRGGWIAFQYLWKRGIVHRNSALARSGINFDFEGNSVGQIKGPSAGLCFLIKMAQTIITEFLELEGRSCPVYDFAGTGDMSTLCRTQNPIGFPSLLIGEWSQVAIG
jgi:hypothetical protein